MNGDAIAVLDLAPAQKEFRDEVFAGLDRQPRMLPSKFFYDERGSELFLQICQLPEYYITRTELAILQERGSEIAAVLGEQIELIGLGTGAGTKTRLLLEHLKNPTAYLPVDISLEQLTQSTAAFSKLFPDLEILPVCADYLRPFDLPSASRTPAHKVVYFPGSTLGNLEPDCALEFLEKIHSLAGEKGMLLIGVDLQKPKEILERAYNDAAGVTAEFNLNLLARANRELDANFDLAQWRHFAFYNERAGRIEMHLVSGSAQRVKISGREFDFAKDEHLVTEYSYKYSRSQLIEMAARAGLRFRELWTDREELFGLFLFAVEERA